MTDDVEAGAWEIINKINAMGGSVTLLKMALYTKKSQEVLMHINEN
jgi:methylmalonyl-CoA mutase N-terminal domain/subunit